MFNKNTGMHDGYIYLIECNLNDMRYVGQTLNKPNKRWNQHKSSARCIKDNHIYLYNAMNKYGLDHFIFKIIEKVSRENKDELIDVLNELEVSYIELYNTLTPNGYNMTAGGDNISSRWKKPVDAYFADGTLYKEYPSTKDAAIDVWGNDDSNKISACCNGITQSCCGFIWRYHGDAFEKYTVNITQERLNRYNNCIKVDKYTMDGKFLKSYETIASAIMDIDSKSNIAHTVIKGCCQGIYNQGYGYVWRFHGDAFDKYNFTTNKKYRQVNAYTNLDEYVGSFISINDAIRKIVVGYKNPSHAHIIECCNGKRKIAYGFKWFYANDPEQPDKTKVVAA